MEKIQIYLVVLDLLRTIKAVKTVLNLGLKEAKDLVEYIKLNDPIIEITLEELVALMNANVEATGARTNLGGYTETITPFRIELTKSEEIIDWSSNKR